MKVVIVIPARFASTRLPGKPLADILGKPMIQHVHERACAVAGVARIVVATDDARVADTVRGFGGSVRMTSASHPTGTDRLAEVMQHVEADLYVNLQGDEPMVRPGDIERLIAGMQADAAVDVGTLCHAIGAAEAMNANTVKAALADNGDALYFSRAPIPYPREASSNPAHGSRNTRYFKHVGVYAYRREVLARYATLAQPTIERTEQLEQLRLLAAGIRIRAFEVAPTGPGVDTPECLERVRAIMAGRPDPVVSFEAGHAADSLQQRLAQVRLVITDVDGVLTDGSLYYDAAGEALKRFHVRDGLGMRMLEQSGIRVAVLSGRDSPVLRRRVADLGVELAAFGAHDKAAACRALMTQAGAAPSQTACIGDDSIDLPAFAVCGISFAVADASDYIAARATSMLKTAGGQGAFREVSDAILRAQGAAHVFETAEGFLDVMREPRQ